MIPTAKDLDQLQQLLRYIESDDCPADLWMHVSRESFVQTDRLMTLTAAALSRYILAFRAPAPVSDETFPKP